MMNVQFFVPAEANGSDLDTVLRDGASRKLLAPFDPALVDFVIAFGKSILLDRESRNYPELVVLGNFFRAANIARLKEALATDDGSACFGRGLVFHIAPSNVDSVFLYSSLLSLLCGNVNLIRISRNAGPQLSFVLAKLAATLAQSELKGRFYVLTYEHDDAITMQISTHCHMRVVWGGDATVRKIRSLALRPTAAELCFPDRFSAAMLNADAVNALDAGALDELCGRFYNDAIWFAQQACSSPRLVAWIGGAEACTAARQRFWQAFAQLLPHKDYENSPGMAMDRFVTACLVATEPSYQETSALLFPTRILLDNTPLAAAKHYHCGNGLFYEQCFDEAPAFLRTLSDQEQTLSVFGYSAQEMAPWLGELPMRALDRITKIGQALDFGVIWDGTNLLQAFTRRISIQL
ncbi:acyl-CoA reductase [Duganella levis]|uniref:Acyl-CoA reductase n=1 Tax=Duganella levis TaxID=2692169 RepID=A0ABW9W7T7_9BURK|nr:acyl-CoA reductase [Duganella levis]MYN29773.1 acyl-CoA reductase [Duganella levis]